MCFHQTGHLILMFNLGAVGSSWLAGMAVAMPSSRKSADLQLKPASKGLDQNRVPLDALPTCKSLYMKTRGHCT